MLKITPLTFKEAIAFVVTHHRRLGRVPCHKFSIAVRDHFGNIRGVAIVGRPINCHMDDGRTAEVTRLCTDGIKNACSMLSAASWRTAKAMGYERIITYTALSEPGTSLRAAGWKQTAITKAKSWNTPSRPRTDKHALEDRYRWTYGEKSPPKQLPPKERMKQGAYLTHALRTGRTETRIREQIRALRKQRRRPTKARIARLLSLSREHVSRRYGHLFQ